MSKPSGVSYQVSGDGPEAVLCHPSLGLGRFLFHRLVPVVSRKWMVVTWDPRGVGDRVQEMPDLQGWVDDTLEILARMDRPVHLFGVSLGSWVMARAALKAKDAVRSLVLQGATVGFADGKAAVEGRRRQLQAEGMASFARAYAADTLEVDNEPLRDNLAWHLAQVPMDKYLAAMNAIYPVDNAAVFKAIAHPTLVMVGNRDQRTSPAEADRVAALIPRAQVAVVPMAGHLAVLDQPLTVADYLDQFIRTGRVHDL